METSHAMQLPFLKALPHAEGRSEFVIIVVADVRGFSEFSRRNESPNIAMYIKRLYLRMIEKYFAAARFVKPTGDGLLMTFPYSEKNLKSVSKSVIESCLRCLADFPTICEGDPMINFSVPSGIGFGIARGTACCLFSGKEILDYSGHLLNLASRLMDLARPNGLVIDGSFLKSVIPDEYVSSFKEQKVYLRSIAEDVPIEVLYLADCVRIPDFALNPMRGESWKTISKDFTMRELGKVGTRYLTPLASSPVSKDKINVQVTCPAKGLKNMRSEYSFTDYDLRADPDPAVSLHIDKLLAKLKSAKLGPRSKLNIKIAYVPTPLPRT